MDAETPTTWESAKAVRARSFGAVAGAYAAWRPDYRSDVVAFLLGGAEGAVPRHRVLDVGAGTGQLSASLVAAGHDVLAVDTSAGMLAELADRLPGVRTWQAPAEELPLPDGDVDAVVAGQAAHWFEPVRAAAEFRRVLRPGGTVGFAWHVRVDDADWAVALAGLLAEESRDQRGDGPEGNAAVVAGFARAFDAEAESLVVDWVHDVPPEAVLGRVASSSRMALLDDAARASYLGRVSDLLATHPETAGRDRIDVTYQTSAYRFTLS